MCYIGDRLVLIVFQVQCQHSNVFGASREDSVLAIYGDARAVGNLGIWSNLVDHKILRKIESIADICRFGFHAKEKPAQHGYWKKKW